MSVTIACLQLSCNDNMARNLEVTEQLLRKAKSSGAELVLTPENSPIMVDSSIKNSQLHYREEDHPALQRYCQFAKELGLWLAIGSIMIEAQGTDKLTNRSYVIDDKGNIRSYYDKLHLFEAQLPGGENYREADRFIAGEKEVLAETPWGKLGLTICYDIRFPNLYRRLAKQGASFITIPSAFTQTTGEAHWHVLLRARAIETGCYIFAPAQTGTHPGGRKTFGHALIVSPWGEVLADAGTEVGMVIAEIHPEKVEETRARIPSLQGE